MLPDICKLPKIFYVTQSYVTQYEQSAMNIHLVKHLLPLYTQLSFQCSLKKCNPGVEEHFFCG